jgi:pilus assembly protein TadC
VAGVGLIVASVRKIQKKTLALRNALDLAHRFDDRLTVIEDSIESLRLTVKRLSNREGMRHAREAKNGAAQLDWRTDPEGFIAEANRKVRMGVYGPTKPEQ